MYRYVLINKDGDIVIRGSTYREIVDALVARNIVHLDIQERFWELKRTGRKFEYAKQEDEIMEGTGFTQESFLDEACYDVIKYLCRNGYALYKLDEYM